MLNKRELHLIESKALDLNLKTKVARDVASIINKLNDYIDENISLTVKDVEEDLATLGGYFTTSLYIPIDPNCKFLRARSFEQHHLEKNVHELSYIPQKNSHDARQGRCNAKGESIYYGCIYFEDKGGVNVGFSEIDAISGKAVNVLRSKNTHQLNVYYIGIYDLVHRECKPMFMDDTMFAKYREIYDYQQEVFTPDVFLAHQLCDAFFSEILRRKAHGNLYNVTSRLTSFFLEEDHIDGIIYTSVKAEGAPVVAIKPQSVDNKLNHFQCDSYNMIYDYGYGRYEALHVSTGNISNSVIYWQLNATKTVV